jgi:hypothetical protein
VENSPGPCLFDVHRFPDCTINATAGPKTKNISQALLSVAVTINLMGAIGTSVQNFP